MRNYLLNLGVRGKLVLLMSILVALVLGGVLLVVCLKTHDQIKTLARNNMQSHVDAFERAENYRMRDRAHITSLIAATMLQSGDFPEPALLDSDPARAKQMYIKLGQDACTFFHDHVMAHSGTDAKDSPHVDFAALEAPEGQVVALAKDGTCQSDVHRWGNLPRIEQAWEDNDCTKDACPDGRPRSIPVMTNWEDPQGGAVYSVFAARVKRSPAFQLNSAQQSSALGVVAVGYRLDNASSKLAQVRAGGDVDVVEWQVSKTNERTRILGSSNTDIAAALNDYAARGIAPQRFTEKQPLNASGQNYVLTRLTYAPAGVNKQNEVGTYSALAQSQTQQMKPFTSLVWTLIVLAVVSLLTGVSLGAVLSGPMVRPLVGLAKVAGDVEGGKYDGIHALKQQHRYAFESRDEIGILCRAFEDMVAGLKKRNAMSKFMSASALRSLGDSGSFHQDGERMWMVVLFSDIRGFTKYSEGRDPQTIVKRLNEVLGIQAESVKKHGGDIDKFIGDAMVAWFNGPDRCTRAVAAATEMIAGLQALTGDSAGRQIGVGIHLGEVIVGALGAQDRQDYTAIGTSVNMASRLCSAAKSGQILISLTVTTELDGSVKLNPLPAVALKGFSEPTAVWEVALDDAASPKAAGTGDIQMAPR